MISYTIAQTNEPRFNVKPAQWVCDECGAVVENRRRHDDFHVRLNLPAAAGGLPRA